MLGAEGLLIDRQRALEKRLNLGVLALLVVQPGEVVEAGGDGGMPGAEGLLLDCQRALVEWLGVGVAPLGAVQLGEVVEALAHVGMLRA